MPAEPWSTIEELLTLFGVFFVLITEKRLTCSVPNFLLARSIFLVSYQCFHTLY